jgi:hypothetical protein
MNSNDKTQTAADTLMRWNIGFEASGGQRTVRGTDQGKDGKPWHCYAWLVTLTNRNVCGTAETLPYYCGLAHVTKPKHSYVQPRPVPPTSADVLYCLLADSAAADQSFGDWCADYGYDDDSMRALETYKACCNSAKQLRRIFTREQIAELHTLLEDY